MRERSRPGAAAASAGAVIPYTHVRPNAKDDSIATHPGHRRRRVHRLAPVRAPARAGARRALRRQLLHRQQAQHPPPARPAALRARAARRHLPALRRGRRDLQPRLPGVADPLPVRPGADDQDLGPRRDQHARPRQAPARADPAGLDERGVRRPRGAPADRGVLGQRQPDRPALVLRRGQALRRDAVLRLPAPAPPRDQGGAHLQHLRAADARPRRPRRVELHRAGAARRADHDLRRRQPDALVLLRRRPGRRARAADGDAGRGHRADQPRQPGRVHRQGARRAGDRAHRLALEDRVPPAAAGRPEAAPAGHRARARDARLGADHAARRRAREDGGVLRSAAQERRGHAGSLPAPRRAAAQLERHGHSDPRDRRRRLCRQPRLQGARGGGLHPGRLRQPRPRPPRAGALGAARGRRPRRSRAARRGVRPASPRGGDAFRGVRLRRRVGAGPGAVLPQQRRRDARARRGDAARGRRGARLLEHLLDLRRARAHADRRGHAAAPDQSVRRDEARDRAHARRLRRRLRAALGEPALLQRRRLRPRRRDRGAARPRDARHPARADGGRRRDRARGGVRHRLPDARRHVPARLRPRRGSRAGPRAGARLPEAGRRDHRGEPGHRARVLGARGDRGRRAR